MKKFLSFLILSIPFLSLAQGTWPIVYPGKAPLAIMMTPDRQIVVWWNLHQTWNLSNNLNHTGPLPVIPSQGNEYNFHYTTSGETKWITEGTPYERLYPFPLSSNNFLLHNPVNDFYTSSNGVIVSPLFAIPNDERILAELGNGQFLSFKGLSPTIQIEIFLRNQSGIITSIRTDQFNKTVYNPITRKFYSIDRYPTTINNVEYALLREFSVSTNSITQDYAVPFLRNFSLDHFLQITDNDEIYMTKDYQIQRFNIQTGVASPVIISDLVLGETIDLRSSNPYTENRACVIQKPALSSYHTIFSRLSAIDFTDPLNITGKQMDTYNFSDGLYLFHNDDLYVAGPMDFGNNCSFGSQQTVFYTGHPQVIITKLNLLSDFNRVNQTAVGNHKQSIENIISFKLSPNPSKNIINIDIKENGLLAKEANYKIIFKNFISNRIVTKKLYHSNTPIDISSLEKGLQIIEVINSKGEKAGSKFIKL